MTATRRRYLTSLPMMLRSQPDEALFALLADAQRDGDALAAAMVETEIDARTAPDESQLAAALRRHATR